MHGTLEDQALLKSLLWVTMIKYLNEMNDCIHCMKTMLPTFQVVICYPRQLMNEFQENVRILRPIAGGMSCL